jgi:Recombination endonuclease VII
MSETAQFKTCSKCGASKPLTEFHRNKHRKDGRHSQCAPCAIAAQNASRGKPPKLNRVRFAPEGMKVCVHCGKTRKIDSFPRYRHSYDGRHHTCKKCMTVHQPKYIPGKNSNAQRAKYWANPEAARDYGISRAHGVPVGTYARLLEIQGGACAICNRSENPGKTRFSFDHDHASGTVRGLLCTLCNQAIGQLQDSPELLRKAADYLEKPPAAQLSLSSTYAARTRKPSR